MEATVLHIKTAVRSWRQGRNRKDRERENYILVSISLDYVLVFLLSK